MTSNNNDIKPDVKKPFSAPPPAPGMALNKEPRVIELKGTVGFDSLPQQYVKKAMANGFTFNILSVGETGIGKTTLMESLFNMPLDFGPCNNEMNTVELRAKSYDVEEGGVHIKLTVVETAGFGDQLDKDKSVKLIVDYINEQYELYLQEEMKVSRQLPLYADTRVHACLYFISPTGHGLKAIDLVALRELSKRTNVIPIIAKADTTSKQELQRFKSKILSELKAHDIHVYRFPIDDPVVAEQNARLNAVVPFAVVASVDFVQTAGGKKRARQYPWGIVEVENEEHCDFVALREALLRVNVEDLRVRTHTYLYEQFRRERLLAMGLGDGGTGPKMAEIIAQKRKEQRETFERRQKEQKDAFIKRVLAKEQQLKREEDEMTRVHEERMRDLQKQLAELDTEIRQMSHEESTMLERRESILSGGKKHKK